MCPPAHLTPDVSPHESPKTSEHPTELQLLACAYTHEAYAMEGHSSTAQGHGEIPSCWFYLYYDALQAELRHLDDSRGVSFS